VRTTNIAYDILYAFACQVNIKAFMGVKDSYNLLTDFRFQFIHFGSDNILYNPSLIHGGKVKHLIVEDDRDDGQLVADSGAGFVQV
jgi:hypothetical protein